MQKSLMTIRHHLAVALTLIVILGLTATRADAQFSSAVEGTVTDAGGGIVPGATVTLTNQDTGVVVTLQTTDAGYYRFPALGSGIYTLRVSLQGFKTVIQEHIRLQVAETRTINLVMGVAPPPKR
jgi:hypothetical protein